MERELEAWVDQLISLSEESIWSSECTRIITRQPAGLSGTKSFSEFWKHSKFAVYLRSFRSNIWCGILMHLPIGLCPGPGGTRPRTAEVVLTASGGRNCCALLSLLLSRCTDAPKVKHLIRMRSHCLAGLDMLYSAASTERQKIFCFEEVEFNSENIYNKKLNSKIIIPKWIYNFIIEDFPTKIILANLLCDENEEFFVPRQDFLNPRCQMSTWDTQK